MLAESMFDTNMKRFSGAFFSFCLSFSQATIAEDPELEFTEISDIPDIVDIANADDGSHRLFLVEQAGRIYIHKDGSVLQAPFLDMRDRVRDNSSEQGLLSLAFAPDYAASGYFYVWYTGSEGETILARYRVSADTDLADPDSHQAILTVPQPFGNHNGGRLQFGLDGMLYLGLGDGGGSNDPQENSQNPNTLLGKVIRLDVNPEHGTYAIPPGNPFTGDEAVLDEIWALGVRNPWKMSFDTMTGDLYIADVGQGEREEINFQAAEAGGGQNYGWDIWEGTLCLGGDDCDQQAFTAPVAEYTHDNGDCAVTGGEVYRGQAYPRLHGTYLYGDFCTGRIWGLKNEGDWVATQLADTAFRIQSFGLGEDGSVYMATTDKVYLVSDGAVVPEVISINAGLNDAWYDPETAGQGFLVAVFEGAGVIFVAWFTFDVERPADDVVAILGDPGHRWLTAQGTFEGNVATMDLFSTSGGVFDSKEPAPDPAEKQGTMTIEWTDCNAAVVSYDLPALSLSGEIPIQRVDTENVPLCEALQ